MSDPLITTPTDTNRLSDGRKVQIAWVLVEVIGKTTQPGMLWGTWYKLACRVLASGDTFTRNVPFDQYVQAEDGGQAYVLAENDGKGWHTAIDSYAHVPPSPARTPRRFA